MKIRPLFVLYGRKSGGERKERKGKMSVSSEKVSLKVENHDEISGKNAEGNLLFPFETRMNKVTENELMNEKKCTYGKKKENKEIEAMRER